MFNDIWASTAFGLVAMAKSINLMPREAQDIADHIKFVEEAVRTNTFALDITTTGQIKLVPSSDLGAPGDYWRTSSTRTQSSSESPAGNTMGNAGEKIPMKGYSAIVPNKMRSTDGYLVISVPCQLWTQGEDGKRKWGRKVVGQWGPVLVPMSGKTVMQKAL